MHKWLVLLSFLVFSINVFGGDIKGVIKDGKDASPLIGVVVNIKNTTIAAVSDADGKYELTGLKDGKYELIFSFISYKKETKTVVLEGGKSVELNVDLQVEGSKELKTVNVTGTRVTRTENAVLMEIKKSSSIVSGISAAQIGKTMDRNAADAVKRIPGVTIQDDRFIVVRGLSDRYNTVWLNDAGTPSSETDKKSFSFDIIPAGLIDRILIAKTPSPELPGDFAGGMIKIYTTSLPDKNELSVGVQTNYRQGSTGTAFNYEPASRTDKFGFDDGKRELPNVISPDWVKLNTQNNDVMAKSFGNNNWVLKSKTLRPDARFNLAASNVFKLKNIKLANTFGASYSSVSTNYTIDRQSWDSTNSENYHYKDLESKTKVTVGLLENFGIAFGNSKIEFKNLYTQIGESKVVYRKSVADSLWNNDEMGYAIGYESRATYSSQLTGTHKSKSDKWSYNWALGYNDLFKNQPDLRRLMYTRTQGLGIKNDTVYKAQVTNAGEPAQGGGMYFAQLHEHVYSFNHNFTYKAKVKNFPFEINAGNYIEYKSRAFESRQFAYGYKNSLSGPNPYIDSLQYLPINQIFTDGTIGTGKFLLAEQTDSTLNYAASNRLIASYLSTKFAIGDFNVSGGARYENNVMKLDGYSTPSTPIHPEVTTNYLLPSVNMWYNISDESLIRIAYGKTLNRPEFREWAPNKFYDFDERADVYGSLYPNVFSSTPQAGDTLKVSQIQNFDVRWEVYPGIGEMFHVGAFYKKIQDPIQKIYIPNGNRVYTFANEKSAYVTGIELEGRKSLGFFDKWFGTKAFQDFVLSGNVSLSQSKLTEGIHGVTPKNPFKYVPLQNQSPYTVNLALFYQNEKAGLQSSLLFNLYGPRLYTLGSNTIGQENIGELSTNTLDFSLTKTFYRHYMINIGVQNILDSKIAFVTDANRDGKFDSKNDMTYKSWKPGRYFSFGLKVKF